jgi:thiol:disulfide interchange protein DsbD
MTLGISRRRLIVLFALNLALLIGGYVLFLKPLVAGLGNLKPGAMQAVGWERYSAKGLEQARAKGKVVFLDFTAQWCWTCKVNERVVLDSAEVDREFVKRGVVLMRADYTSQDAGIFKLLQSFGAAGVPLYVVYPADKDKEPKVLPTILTKEIVLGAISK